jgi:hypothetical protein
MRFQTLHRACLMDLSRVGIAKHHLYSGVTEHGCERDRINTALCRSRRYRYSSAALLRYFRDTPIDRITAESVENFKLSRAAESGSHTERRLRPATTMLRARLGASVGSPYVYPHSDDPATCLRVLWLPSCLSVAVPTREDGSPV